jgi:tetratricopeptide (TPR) repeat protein
MPLTAFIPLGFARLYEYFRQRLSSLYKKLLSNLPTRYFITLGVAIAVAAGIFCILSRTTPSWSLITHANISEIIWILLLASVLAGGATLLPGQSDQRLKQLIVGVVFTISLSARLATPTPVLPPADTSGVESAITDTNRPAITLTTENARIAQQMVDSNPNDEETGEGYLALNRYQNSIDRFGVTETALKKHLAEIHYKKARAYWGLAQSDLANPDHGMFQMALKEADLSLNFRPMYSPALVVKCIALRDANQLKEALVACNDATTADRNNGGAWNAKGATLITMGDQAPSSPGKFYEDARGALDIGINIRPTRELLTNRAFAYQRMEKYPDALRDIRQALNISPNFSNALLIEASLLRRKKDYAGAADAYRKLTQANPSDPDAWASLGDALEGTGQADEALICYDKALQIRPDLPAALFDKGQALNKRDRYQEAIEPLTKARASSPNDPELLYEFAFALYMSDKSKKIEALQVVSQAIRLNPRYKAASALRRAILANSTAVLDTTLPPV